MKKLQVAILPVVIILGALSIIGCGSTPAQPAGNGTTSDQAAVNEVVMKGISFQPNEITIAVGDTVTWINEDSTNHTVIGDKTGTGDDFESGSLSNGQKFTHTFTQAGTYPYHCSIHPSMKGTVIVK